MPGDRVVPASLTEDLPPSVAAVLEEFVAALLRATGSKLDAVRVNALRVTLRPMELQILQH
jgi:hypothetical protein